jgi:hypothetical protein
MDRGREFIGQRIALPDAVTDLESSCPYLQAYAEKVAPTPVGSTASGRTASWWAEVLLLAGLGLELVVRREPYDRSLVSPWTKACRAGSSSLRTAAIHALRS